MPHIALCDNCRWSSPAETHGWVTCGVPLPPMLQHVAEMQTRHIQHYKTCGLHQPQIALNAHPNAMEPR